MKCCSQITSLDSSPMNPFMLTEEVPQSNKWDSFWEFVVNFQNLLGDIVACP